jgi:quercetin dioxygenase-like cupin family protein
MKFQNQLWWGIFALSLVLIISASTQGQMAGQMTTRNMAEMKFATVPGLPTQTVGSVQSGDPAKGPFILLAKAAAGSTVPWHWHTANERLMIVSGAADVEMKDGNSVRLEAGGFAALPAQHVHQFRCERDCTFYLDSDGAFDIHYVNGQGTEISAADALKAVNETPAG